MKGEDFAEFRALWNAVSALYGKEVNDMATGMAFRALSRFELSDIKYGLDRHSSDVNDGRFMPKPANIIKHVLGDPEAQSLLAWTEIESTLRRVSPYESIVFDSPAKMAAIQDMGGWAMFHQKKEQEMPFVAKEFAKRHEYYLNNPPAQWPKKFIGIQEASNTMTGHKSFVPEPLLIGNEERAALVYQRGVEHRQGPQRLGDVLKRIAQDFSALPHKKESQGE